MPGSFRGRALTRRERGQDHDKRRYHEKEYRKWYKTAAWLKRRADQLQRFPLCARCEKDKRIVAASVVNHIGGHGGVWDRFINGPIESVCKPCHDGVIQREEAAGRKNT